MASKGHIGSKARVRSYNDDQSRDSMINQFKMYAEVFRLLGWIRSVSSCHSSRTVYRITYLGCLVAEAIDPRYLLEQCLLAVSFPNDANNIKFKNHVSPFLTILKTMASLDGLGCRDEFIIGPLSLNNDQNRDEFNEMIIRLKSIRSPTTQAGRVLALDGAFRELLVILGLSEDTVQNYTRIPIAALKGCKWAQELKTNVIYGNKKNILSLTDHGKELLAEMENMYVVHCNTVMNLELEARKAVSLFGLIHLLKRAKYNTAPLEKIADPYEQYLGQLLNYKKGQQILFSPYQQLSPEQLDVVLGELLQYKENSLDEEKELTNFIDDAELMVNYGSRLLPEVRVPVVRIVSPGYSSANLNQTTTILGKLTDACGRITNISDATQEVFKHYFSANKDIFYPAIGDLFNAIGFRCEVWRSGITGLRWDAILADENYSIPIEIKSPGEEKFIQVKGIRQALENKIILDSRMLDDYKTTRNTTTLVVGYFAPNDRAEVGELVNDIKKVYKINIGIIDFKTLLFLAALRIRNRLIPEFSEFRTLSGVMHVNYT